MYIFIRFINSLPKPWLNEVGCVNGMGYINKVGCRVSEVKVGVLMVVCGVRFSVILMLVLMLAKLFLRR